MSKVESQSNRGNAGKGRPKGSLNRVTLQAREAILLAAEGLGGVERLIKWVNKNDENEKLFWTVIYPKVLPIRPSAEEVAAAAPPPVTGALVWEKPPRPDPAALRPWAPPGQAGSGPGSGPRP